jgi:Taurine catabolism dioxygenase TauD, TfdA family
MATGAHQPLTGARAPAWSAPLASRGWVLVEGAGDRPAVEAMLAEIGELSSQYQGRLRHEVRYRPGYDDLQYSQSANAITPHTEAPGLDPPPRYLALHCHRQACCGGGHTMLADCRAFLAELPARLRAEARRRPIRFDLASGVAIKGRAAVAAPLESRSADGAPIVRYSYNVLRDGALEGPARERDDLDGLDPFRRELCLRGRAFCARRGARVLIPDAGLLVFDNWRMLHSRTAYSDRTRHLTRYWIG